MNTPISTSEYSQLRSDKTPHVGIDVRSPEEYADGHIEGVVNVPVEEIEGKIESLVPNKDDLVILNCRSGGRAGRTAPKLRAMGYTNVRPVKGAFEDVK